MIILNEKEYAESCLKNGIENNNPYLTLSILARYYYHHLGYRKKRIQKLLTQFLDKHYPRYELNQYTWQSTIEKLATKAGNYPLLEITGIKVTQSEMNTILNIKNKVLERLAFTMLCLAKFGNSRNSNNNGWVNADSKDIFNYARISCKADEREIKIGKLWQMGLLEFSKRNDNLNCRVTYINDEGNEELFISDFRELGYEYLKFKGENFIRCAECGILTRGNKAGTKKYCKNCTTYMPQETKTITCIDCGKRFQINSKNSRSTRCPDCQHKKQLEYQRISMMKSRNVK
ncbi:MAG: hypothetical protein II304_08665 [Bacteroidales bacterium]|nr:hypothetical protein [Bacteroidales bacterium]